MWAMVSTWQAVVSVHQMSQERHVGEGVCDLEVLRTEHVEDVSPHALNAMVFDEGWERSSTCR